MRREGERRTLEPPGILLPKAGVYPAISGAWGRVWRRSAALFLLPVCAPPACSPRERRRRLAGRGAREEHRIAGSRRQLSGPVAGRPALDEIRGELRDLGRLRVRLQIRFMRLVLGGCLHAKAHRLSASHCYLVRVPPSGKSPALRATRNGERDGTGSS